MLRLPFSLALLLSVVCLTATTLLLPSKASAQSLIDFTPTTGNLVQLDDPWWANKGYEFTAQQDFSITGGAWWINMPVDGFVRLTICDCSWIQLAQGGQVWGNGTEQWYESALNYTFMAGTTYTASF